jgi:hypothetical protein
MRRVRLAWIEREPPLAVAGVVGLGPAARALGRRLLARGDAEAFRGLVREETLVLLGRDPPWAEGVVYLGREPLAPGLYLPTRLRTVEDPSLVGERLLLEGVHGAAALLPEQGIVLALAEARRLDPDQLRDWVDHDGAA